MLRSIIDRFKKAQGPMPQMRIVVADLAEEVLDLSEHYAKRLISKVPSRDSETQGCTGGCECETHSSPPCAQAPAPTPVKTTTKTAAPKKNDEPTRELEVSNLLLDALDKPANRKKQAFKVLGILWDAKQRKLPPMSAKGIAAHGEKLGLAIRHENVRKVIRMRLEKHVDVHTEEAGTGSIYRYTISKSGAEYFETTYFN